MGLYRGFLPIRKQHDFSLQTEVREHQSERSETKTKERNVVNAGIGRQRTALSSVVPSDAYNGEKEATAQVQILAWTLPSK